MATKQEIDDAFVRLKSRVSVDDGGCWIWLGSTNKDMYGQIKVAGKAMATHRLAYMASVAEIPRGKVIRHRCDVRTCCNPAHLEVGDHEDNVQDIVDRGHHKTRRVLSVDERALVASMRKQGSTKRQIAEALKCNWYAVSAAIDASGVDGKGKPGRPKGSRNASHKVSDEAKQQIKNLYATGKFTQQMLAERFDCDQTYVSLIVRGKK